MFSEVSGESLKRRPLSSFIRKLWFILTEEYNQFIQWVDHGQVICIPNSTTFSEVILPKLFKHNNWQSFVRQLNLYGFRKVYPLNLDNDEPLDKRAVWYFKHDSFQKNKPDLLYDIKRQVNKAETQEQTRQLEKDINDNSNREIEEELSQVKLKLLEADEKSNDLYKHIKLLRQMQHNQQQIIDSLVKAVSDVASVDSSINYTITETVNRISHINKLNKHLLESGSMEEIDELKEEDDDFEDHVTMQRQEVTDLYTFRPVDIPVSSFSKAANQSNHLSINSLIHDELSHPAKRKKK